MTTKRMSRRERQAAETRNEILAAARRLFADQGYTATTIANIASEAGTAIQTIYASVGTKAKIVHALADLIDVEAGAPEIGRQLGETSNPEELIRLTVRLTRQIYERCGDVIRALWSATGDPAVAETLALGHQRNRDGAHHVAGRLAQLGALREGLSVEQAGDTVLLLTSVESYHMLTVTCQWTFDEAETWINDCLKRLLMDAASS